ncbi:MAG: hypothetical protein VX498_04650, partial [Myxococcota bacterium]|nr:hypothetical protein [Myxococcota bacterium]
LELQRLDRKKNEETIQGIGIVRRFLPPPRKIPSDKSSVQPQDTAATRSLRGLTSQMEWPFEISRTEVHALLQGARGGLVCGGEVVGQTRESWPDLHLVWNPVVQVTEPKPPTFRRRFYRQNDGSWRIVHSDESMPASLRPKSATIEWEARDHGFGELLDELAQRLSAPGRKLWDDLGRDCSPELPEAARPEEVLLSYTNTGSARTISFLVELKRSGRRYRYSAMQHRGRKERSWNGSIPGALVDALVSAVHQDVHCGPAEPARFRFHDSPSRSISLHYEDVGEIPGPWLVKLASKSQGRTGAPWSVVSGAGFGLLEGAQDTGLIGSAANTLLSELQDQGPDFVDAPPRDRRRSRGRRR